VLVLKIATISQLWRRGRRRCVLFAVFMLASVLSASAAPTSQRLIGRRAPEFIRKDLRGETIDLARYRGKVVLLNFWATWCAPCRAELPRFDQWQAEFKAEGFQLIAVAMDDDPALVRNVVGKLHLALPVVMGDAKLGDLYGGVFGFPVSYLIDRDGIVRYRFEGETQSDQFEQRIQVLLKTTPQ
jgi:peroxiredoxin